MDIYLHSLQNYHIFNIFQSQYPLIHNYMCQCLICDCCWWNCCGICCAGLHSAYCCMSCWVCKPVEMINPDCCNMCMWTGWGGNCFCHGTLCCAPEYVKQFSRYRLCGAGTNVIIVNQNTPLSAQMPY